MSAPEPSLFANLSRRGAAATAVSDAAWLQAMLDVEIALARALARTGSASESAAEAIAHAALPARLSLAELARGTLDAGNPVPSLVKQIERGLAPDASAALHRGATSQDILDTAMMLISKKALEHIVADLRASADVLAELARLHRNSVMLGRTLLQPAVPVSFGLKAAGWLTALDQAGARLDDLRRNGLVLQLGGAAGTLAPLGGRGLDVMSAVAAQLGLGVPVLPWHTLRAPVLALAAAAGIAAAALGKIARDVILLAQFEVGELSEAPAAERGGSSTLPHKRNPIGSVAALSCTRRVPALVATLLSAAEQEHERAAGAWHAEWETLTELLRLLGSAATWMREVLSGLEVNVARMRANLDATGGLPFAERVSQQLIGVLGRSGAEALVRDAVQRAERRGAHLRDVLLGEPDLAQALNSGGIAPDRVAALFEPDQYLGSSAHFIDRALEAHETAKRSP